MSVLQVTITLLPHQIVFGCCCQRATHATVLAALVSARGSPCVAALWTPTCLCWPLSSSGRVMGCVAVSFLVHFALFPVLVAPFPSALTVATSHEISCPLIILFPWGWVYLGSQVFLCLPKICDLLTSMGETLHMQHQCSEAL